jgi:hypothetical protein
MTIYSQNLYNFIKRVHRVGNMIGPRIIRKLVISIREALIKSVRGEPVEPRTDESPQILRHFPFTPFGWLRTGFDMLRANGRLNQSFLSTTTKKSML